MAITKTVLARNTVSGVVAQVPESYLTHPHFGKQLVRVEEGAKSALPELYHAKDSKGNEVDEAAKPKAPAPVAPKAPAKTTPEK